MKFVCLIAASVLCAACNGGTVDRHALTNDAATIDSINCESWLLARATAHTRTTTQFTGEQAEELHIQAANLANALAKRPTAAGLEQRTRARARDARLLANRLAQLQHRPGDRALAARLAGAFRTAGGCS